MTQLSDFPRLDLRPLKIRDGLTSLYSNGLFAQSIERAFFNEVPLYDICKMIMEQYKVDPIDVEFVIGPDLLKLIRDVYGNL